MTCDLGQINDVKEIQPIPISLPNGSRTLAAKKGAIALEGKGILKRV